MLIETTYMRMGHGPAGATGVATDYNQMMKWALSFALCGEVSQTIRAMSNTKQDILSTLTIRKKLRVESRQTRLIA
jgi:hypothetical protein